MFIDRSRRNWKSVIGFTFGGVDDLRRKLFDLSNERDRLKVKADELLKDWKENFPRSSVPIYLTRVSDRSLSTLRWRRSKTHSDKAAQVSFDDAIEFFHVESQRNLVFKFESFRMDLNLKLSLVLYDIHRLEIYLAEVKSLTDLRK